MLETCAIGLNPKKTKANTKKNLIKKMQEKQNFLFCFKCIFRAQSRFNFGSLLIVLYNFVSCAPPKPHKKIEKKKKYKQKRKKKTQLLLVQRNDL